MQATKEQITAALKIMLAVGDAIRELGSVPSGRLYARLMGHLTLQQYQQIIDRLKGAGLVEEKMNVLTWVGPKKVAA